MGDAPEDLKDAVLRLAEIGTTARYPDDDAESIDVALTRVYGMAAQVVLEYAIGQIPRT